MIIKWRGRFMVDTESGEIECTGGCRDCDFYFGSPPGNGDPGTCALDESATSSIIDEVLEEYPELTL